MACQQRALILRLRDVQDALVPRRPWMAGSGPKEIDLSHPILWTQYLDSQIDSPIGTARPSSRFAVQNGFPTVQ